MPFFSLPAIGCAKTKSILSGNISIISFINNCLSPFTSVIDRNKDKNINLIEDLAYKMGFKHVKRICPKYHDEMIAFTSQLPHALAVALINSDIEGRNTGEFIGDSYRDLTRIANINDSL